MVRLSASVTAASWSRRGSNRGFSMVELVVAMAIAAAMLAAAVPNYLTFRSDQRAVSRANELVADLGAARLEAVRRGGTAALAADGSWAVGWTVTTVDNGADPPTTITLGRRRLPAPDGDLVERLRVVPDDTTSVAFGPTGALTTVGVVQFLVCEGSGKSLRARSVSVAPSGYAEAHAYDGAGCE